MKDMFRRRKYKKLLHNNDSSRSSIRKEKINKPRLKKIPHSSNTVFVHENSCEGVFILTDHGSYYEFEDYDTDLYLIEKVCLFKKYIVRFLIVSENYENESFYGSLEFSDDVEYYFKNLDNNSAQNFYNFVKDTITLTSTESTKSTEAYEAAGVAYGADTVAKIVASYTSNVVANKKKKKTQLRLKSKRRKKIKSINANTSKKPTTQSIAQNSVTIENNESESGTLYPKIDLGEHEGVLLEDLDSERSVEPLTQSQQELPPLQSQKYPLLQPSEKQIDDPPSYETVLEAKSERNNDILLQEFHNSTRVYPQIPYDNLEPLIWEREIDSGGEDRIPLLAI